MKAIRTFYQCLLTAGKSFANDNAFKLSASLSYYTIFALGPVLLLMMSLAGIFFGKEAVQGKIFGQLRGLLGNSAAYQIQSIISNIHKSDQTFAGTIVGLVILVIGATGVFTEIQSSINYIWSIRAKPEKGWLKLLLNRLLSFSLVIGLSFVLMVALIVNALMDLLNAEIANFFPGLAIISFYTFNLALIFSAITLLFAVIFHVLPDARISWRDSFAGAAFTATLFLVGKLLITFYIGKADFGFTYGAAASIIIILVWVYYSSLILYFGAAFTRAFALYAGHGIQPDTTAVFIIKRESKEIAVNDTYGPPIT
ncbi:YihY/virulence factor BrkB family protein [Flavihumibacter petaseus]|uniref:Uncharacterized protein n=1 Tax=Flavihumibacter petaseus NBRC 106054 TaxID=1220578 RepID=A0A0E9MY57_9BACT|nr:YihY/virulence factor BrkB family protein [Flavihumibacter petaseus]GAO42428.1 hypothetical protein FPE01S_01_14430 [Flavihumibacter petaseus NBRC 106054]